MQKVITVDETFSVLVLDKEEKVDLRGGPHIVEGRLSEAYILPDGAVGDKPSFVFVIDVPTEPPCRVVGQLSAAMFNVIVENLKDL